MFCSKQQDIVNIQQSSCFFRDRQHCSLYRRLNEDHSVIVSRCESCQLMLF